MPRVDPSPQGGSIGFPGFVPANAKGTPLEADKAVVGDIRKVLAQLAAVLGDDWLQQYLNRGKLEVDSFKVGLEQVTDQYNAATTEINANKFTDFAAIGASVIKLSGAYDSYNIAKTGAPGSAEKATALNAMYTASSEIISHAASILASKDKLTAEEDRALAGSLKVVSDFLASQASSSSSVSQQFESLRSDMAQKYQETNSEVYNLLVSH